MSPLPPEESIRDLIDRVQALLPDHQRREVRMFGVTAIMVDNVMALAVHPDGSLLVRVDPADDAALLRHPSASRAEMGTGRSMGEGWIRVHAEGGFSEADLARWVRAATVNLARLTAGHR